MTLDVASVMTRDVIMAAPTDAVSAIARLLSLHAISAVPVCDAQGHLLGIISEGDLIRGLRDVARA
jgi:CBS domain-containing protein